LRCEKPQNHILPLLYGSAQLSACRSLPNVIGARKFGVARSDSHGNCDCNAVGKSDAQSGVLYSNSITGVAVAKEIGGMHALKCRHAMAQCEPYIEFPAEHGAGRCNAGTEKEKMNNICTKITPREREDEQNMYKKNTRERR